MSEAENGRLEDLEGMRRELSSIRSELTAERGRRKKAEEAVEKLRESAAKSQILVEQEEEYISNKLMKRLAELKEEKESLALQIEQEEEYLTNNLQLKLDQLKREKIEMENQLEQEQEYIVNKLQRQRDDMRNENLVLEKKVEELSRTATPATMTPNASRPDSPASSARSGAVPSEASSMLPGRSFSRDSS